MNALPDFAPETFRVPPELEAREPAEMRGRARERVRMLVSDRASGALRHVRFEAISEILRPGDLLVANDSATLPAALRARRGDGGVVALHVADEVTRAVWLVEPRGIGIVRAGETFALPGNAAVTLASPFAAGNRRLWYARVDVRASHADYLRAYGTPIRYAYANDDIPIESYQTIFARSHASGSAEMPSAGRPFAAKTIDELHARGIDVRTITLHAGVSSPEACEEPQPERFAVTQRSADAVNAARREGRRVIAIGTTVVRALESASHRGIVHATSGRTNRLVNREHPPRIVDGLLTGFHEPRASHLTLLETFFDRASLSVAYRAAIESGYLWHEFGDVHLIV